MPASGHRRLGYHGASRRNMMTGRPIALRRLLRQWQVTPPVRKTTPCWDLAGGHQPPKRDSSLRARATIMVLRVVPR